MPSTVSLSVLQGHTILRTAATAAIQELRARATTSSTHRRRRAAILEVALPVPRQADHRVIASHGVAVTAMCQWTVVI